MRIIISGASGFVGGALVAHLENQEHDVVRLVRRRPTDEAMERRWDPTASVLDPAILSGADVVINLNGRSISQGRWSAQVKDELRSSRLDATRTIVQAIARADDPPPLLISASATGFYGDRGDERLSERSARGDGFLAELAGDWEAAALEGESDATRVVLIRLGMILGDGAALAKMLPPFKLGFGGPMGNGRQWWPWIAMDDVLGAINHVIARDDIRGPVNLVAPETATSKSFARALGEYLGRPAIVPAPAFAVKLALGEMAEALLLSSTKVQPVILEETGYEFRAPTLAAAFRRILG
jgi:uncharacterized protein (TIGR01777 family)